MATVAETLALALRHHRAGNLPAAEQFYRQVLQADPANADALNLLGMLAHQVGRHDLAASYIGQALAARPREAAFHSNLGLVLQARGRPAEAEACFREAVRCNPAYAEAQSNLGAALQQRGRAAEAEAHLREAVRLDPGYAEAHYNLGLALLDQARPAEAEACFRDALRLKSGDAEIANNLGVALKQQGRLEEAEAVLRRAIHLNPRLAEVHYNLGSVLQEQGRLMDARDTYREALRLKPAYAEAYCNLGLVFQVQGQPAAAEVCFREAVRLNPGYAEGHYNLGAALQEQGHVAEVEAHFREALRLKPNDRARAALALLLPPVYRSPADVQAWRQRLTGQLAGLHRDGLRLSLADQTGVLQFYLAYQGYNERDVQRDIARLHVPPPDLPLPPPAGRARDPRRIQVGFISGCFREHTVGKLMRGFIARLARDAFEVTVLSIGRYDDEPARLFRRHADRYVEVPGSLPAARRLIAEQGLDVLFYADIGMEPVSYSLAFSRLAPVQCVAFGHPVTTGIPTMDYYLSSDLFEPEGADQHYTEELVRLRGLCTYYYRPALAAARGRGHFGLRDADHVYACPQSLFKFHPAFDEMLAAILRADPRGVLLLLRGPHPYWEELLLDRWRAVMPDVLQQVRWVPRQDWDGFLNLNAVADVLLDPYPFGGGNTSLEALALGVPVVTLPAAFLRGRVTLGMYRKMGLLDCVAASPREYAEVALRLGTDAAYRAEVRAKILAAADVLYEDAEAVRELERFFRQAVADAGEGKGRGSRGV